MAKEFFFDVVFHLFLLPFEFTTFLSLGRPSLPGNSFRPLFLFVCCLKFRPVNAKLSWHQMQAMLIQVSDRYISPWRQNTSHLLWHTISLIEVMSFKNIRLIKTRRQQKKIFCLDRWGKGDRRHRRGLGSPHKPHTTAKVVNFHFRPISTFCEEEPIWIN